MVALSPWMLTVETVVDWSRPLLRTFSVSPVCRPTVPVRVVEMLVVVGIGSLPCPRRSPIGLAAAGILGTKHKGRGRDPAWTDQVRERAAALCHSISSDCLRQKGHRLVDHRSPSQTCPARDALL